MTVHSTICCKVTACDLCQVYRHFGKFTAAVLRVEDGDCRVVATRLHGVTPLHLADLYCSLVFSILKLLWRNLVFRGLVRHVRSSISTATVRSGRRLPAGTCRKLRGNLNNEMSRLTMDVAQTTVQVAAEPVVTLKMEAVRSAEKSEHLIITRRRNPKRCRY